MYMGSVFAILPGRDRLLGRYSTREEYVSLLDRAYYLDQSRPGMMGVSVHGHVRGQEISGEMGVQDAYLLSK